MANNLLGHIRQIVMRVVQIADLFELIFVAHTGEAIKERHNCRDDTVSYM